MNKIKKLMPKIYNRCRLPLADALSTTDVAQPMRKRHD